MGASPIVCVLYCTTLIILFEFGRGLISREFADLDHDALAPFVGTKEFLSPARVESFIKPQELKLGVYLTALAGAVEIIEVPDNNQVYSSVIDSCAQSTLDNLRSTQHALEYYFPELLERTMVSFPTEVGVEKVHMVWNKSVDTPTMIKNEGPLFYYLKMFPYTVVVCGGSQGRAFDMWRYSSRWQLQQQAQQQRLSVGSTGSNVIKEDWTKGALYIEAVATWATGQLDQWRSGNEGVDFLSPASHPKSILLRRTRAPLTAFQRQAFLRTDFDFSGHRPKDIVVPYFISSSPVPPLSPLTPQHPQPFSTDLFQLPQYVMLPLVRQYQRLLNTIFGVQRYSKIASLTVPLQ